MIERSTRAIGSPALPETSMFRAHAELCNAPGIANLAKLPHSRLPGHPRTKVVCGAPGLGELRPGGGPSHSR